LFAQATSLSTTFSLASITEDILNIKETFPNIQNKKNQKHSKNHSEREQAQTLIKHDYEGTFKETDHYPYE